MYQFNEGVDKAVIKPVAEGYRKVVPAGIRKGVGNVFLNLTEPTTIVNDLLQGKFNQAGHDLMRFVVNSTFGLFGWFDLATPLGMERHEESFGQTFTVWGLGQGPYLVLPFIGPSTVADAVGMVPATLYTDLRTTAGDGSTTWILLGVNVVDSRARLLGASKVVELQLDPYVFRRESYLQQRRNRVYDGNPPLEEEWQEDWEEDWEEDW
jgi:phospholipid-binding lipoprotein MlaA